MTEDCVGYDCLWLHSMFYIAVVFMVAILSQFDGHEGPKCLDNVATIAVATFFKNLDYALRLNKRSFAAV